MPTQSQQQWKDRPAPKLQIHKLRVDSIEASTRFEGRWVCQGALDDSRPIKFWMSFKQAGSINKNLDAETLYCVVDHGDPEKPRFVWASNALDWLQNSFLKDKPAEAPVQAAPVKTAPKKPQGTFKVPATPNRFEAEEELPF